MDKEDSKLILCVNLAFVQFDRHGAQNFTALTIEYSDFLACNVVECNL